MGLQINFRAKSAAEKAEIKKAFETKKAGTRLNDFLLKIILRACRLINKRNK